MTVDNFQFHDGHLPGGAEMDALSAGQTEEPDAALHPLDSDESLALLERIKGWYDEESDRQRENRLKQARDCDYYDHLQITQRDREELEQRGQAPLVFNRIKLAVDWILGTEVRTRFQGVVKPRSEDDVAIAPIKTDLMKYVDDANQAGQQRSSAFKDQVVAGLGWLEAGITVDPTQELVYDRAESWRNMLHDSLGKPDQTDSRFLFRHRSLDLDFAVAMFPERADILESSAMGGEEDRDINSGNWFMGKNLAETGLTDGDTYSTFYHSSGSWSTSKTSRKRVRLVECWYRLPETRQIVRGSAPGISDGDVYDPAKHDAAAENGDVSIVQNLTMRMQSAIFCKEGLLHSAPMPYKHNRFPLTPLWCYRRDRDGMPYGMVRGMVDPQDDFNKRMSKSLFLMSVNRVMFDEGAFGENEEEARIELSRPDAFQSKKRGYEVAVHNGTDLAPAQLQLADRDLQHIEAASGVTNEQLGMATNAVSGKAITARQTQGSVTTAMIFDKYREGYEAHNRVKLSLIEQYYTMQKVIRIVGGNAAKAFLTINQPDPKDPTKLLNDISRSICDFVMDEEDARATTRQAQVESVVSILQSLDPGQVPNWLDFIFGMCDFPQATEMAKRARIINGMAPPEGVNVSPEEQAAAAQRQQVQGQQMALQMRSMIAQATKMEAEARKAGSAADLADATAILQKATTIYEIMQAAGIVTTTPFVTTAGDELLKAIGFQDAGGAGIPLPYPTDPSQPGGQQQAQPQGTDVSGHGTAPQAGPPRIPPSGPAQSAGARAGIETVANDGGPPQ